MDNFDKKLMDAVLTLVKNGDVDIALTARDEKEEMLSADKDICIVTVCAFDKEEAIKALEKAIDVINNKDYTGIVREKITRGMIEE